MVIKLNENMMFIFDLDDTLFREMDFLISAYKHIASRLQPEDPEPLFQKMLEKYHSKENVFAWLGSGFGNDIPELDLQKLLAWYREHQPEIKLEEDVREFLDELKLRKIPLGLITDGRSITQRNKLKALGIEDLSNDIIISEEFGSEKPDPRNYVFFEENYKGREFYFFGDNTGKDFIIPEKLGWNIICLKNPGSNIHPQDFENFPASGNIISSFKEIKLQ